MYTTGTTDIKNARGSRDSRGISQLPGNQVLITLQNLKFSALFALPRRLFGILKVMWESAAKRASFELSIYTKHGYGIVFESHRWSRYTKAIFRNILHRHSCGQIACIGLHKYFYRQVNILFIYCYFEAWVLVLKRIVLDFEIRLSVLSNSLKISPHWIWQCCRVPKGRITADSPSLRIWLYKKKRKRIFWSKRRRSVLKM